jgi:Predicted secreted protein
MAVCASSVMAGNDGTTLVATYGETTHTNQQYMNSVNDYFASKGYSNLENVKQEVITANQVNQISKGISGKTYGSNQIFSSALVDLTQGDSLKVTVDTSKINLVTAKMYASALESAGIEKGGFNVTSPVSATGESALAGVMSCYEKRNQCGNSTGSKQAAK